MNTYIVDDEGNKELVDWHDFMTNDNNPTLNRLADKLLKDPKFQKIMLLKDPMFQKIMKDNDEPTN